MITVLRPMAATSDPVTRSPALYRDGLTSARRELQAGTARRYRAEARRTGGLDAAVATDADPMSNADLATQRAGVRAAQAELRQHRGAP